MLSVLLYAASTLAISPSLLHQTTTSSVKTSFHFVPQVVAVFVLLVISTSFVHFLPQNRPPFSDPSLPKEEITLLVPRVDFTATFKLSTHRSIVTHSHLVIPSSSPFFLAHNLVRPLCLSVSPCTCYLCLSVTGHNCTCTSETVSCSFFASSFLLFPADKPKAA